MTDNEKVLCKMIMAEIKNTPRLNLAYCYAMHSEDEDVIKMLEQTGYDVELLKDELPALRLLLAYEDMIA